MNAFKNQILIFTILLFTNSCKSQTYSLHFEGENVESIEEKGSWYLITPQKKIKECTPKIEFVKDEENEFEGNILTTNEESILIFNSNKKLTLNKNSNQNLESEQIEIGSKIQINENLILHAVSKTIGEDEILSLDIEDKNRKVKYEIFRNCRIINDINSYFGCGRLPFMLDFIGDIINDENPEIILSADKEGSVLKLIIGFKDDKYQILKWTEFE